MKILFSLIAFIIATSFLQSNGNKDSVYFNKGNKQEENTIINPAYDSTYKVIHVFVALCDNKFQGIVPVPAKIGNGRDLNNNLYWGCGFGIRSYFKKSNEWKLLRQFKIDSIKLERLLFKHVSKKYYLVADAYNGQFIKKCTQDFLNSTSGKYTDTIHADKLVIGINGHSKLCAYIGHDGLMDFNLNESYLNTDNKKRDCIILACISKRYFSSYLQHAKANPLLWTTGLMCPEAYTLHDALSGYVLNESGESIRNRAAIAYSTHQKCGLKAAKNLLVTGF